MTSFPNNLLLLSHTYHLHIIQLTINAIEDIIQSFKKITDLYEIKSLIKRKIHLHTI